METDVDIMPVDDELLVGLGDVGNAGTALGPAQQQVIAIGQQIDDLVNQKQAIVEAEAAKGTKPKAVKKILAPIEKSIKLLSKQQAKLSKKAVKEAQAKKQILKQQAKASGKVGTAEAKASGKIGEAQAEANDPLNQAFGNLLDGDLGGAGLASFDDFDDLAVDTFGSSASALAASPAQARGVAPGGGPSRLMLVGGALAATLGVVFIIRRRRKKGRRRKGRR